MNTRRWGSSRAILEEIDDARFGKELLKKTPVYIKEEENKEMPLKMKVKIKKRPLK